MAGVEEAIRLWHSDGIAKLPPDPLACVRDGPLAHVIINRPAKRNAITAQIWQELPALLKRLANEASVKLIVLRGAGTAAFSAGADIDEFPTVYGTPELSRTYNAAARTAQLAVERLGKPTLALVFGACVGGGCGLALACDLRFAAEDARFGITPSKLGTAYSVSDTRRLVAVLGPSRAKDMLFSGRLLSASEAIQWGLIDRIAPPGELEESAIEYARMLLANSHQSLVVAKAMVNAVAGIHDRPDGELERLFQESFTSRDFREGFDAFREKRQPLFD